MFILQHMSKYYDETLTHQYICGLKKEVIETRKHLDKKKMIKGKNVFLQHYK